MEDGDLRQAARRLSAIYPHDVENFADELVQMKDFFKNDNTTRNPEGLLKRLITVSDTFPNVVVALRMYMTLPSSNASGERSFSCLKRIKNYLRSTLSQERLDALALLSIECDLTRSLDFSDVIEMFAHAKSRKRHI
jgi:hypothetical protein